MVMTTMTNTAKKSFEENIRLFADAQSEPEKYNLYNGLHALAGSIDEVQAKLEDIYRRLRALETG